MRIKNALRIATVSVATFIAGICGPRIVPGTGAAALAATPGAGAGAAAGGGQGQATGANVGDKIAFAFTDLAGQPISIEALRGKIVIVDMWATWCGPCMAEAPHMVEINQKYGPQGLQIIGISLDQDKGRLVSTIAKVGFTWPQYFDGQGWQNKYAALWGVRGIPHTILIGPDGTVLWVGHPAAIDEPLAAAFKDHPPVLVDPAIVKAANATLDAIEADFKSQKTAEAAKLLSEIPAEASKDTGVAARAADVKGKVEAATTQMLADVDALIAQKDYVKAAAQLEELSKDFNGLAIEADVRKKLDALLADPDANAAMAKAKREAAADDALAVAQQLKDHKKDEAAYLKFKEVAASFAGTPAAVTAAGAVAEYEKDPAFVKRANAGANSDKAKAALAAAESYRAAGMTDKAKEKYQLVITKYPGTPEAAAAAKAIGELGN